MYRNKITQTMCNEKNISYNKLAKSEINIIIELKSGAPLRSGVPAPRQSKLLWSRMVIYSQGIALYSWRAMNLCWPRSSGENATIGPYIRPNTPVCYLHFRTRRFDGGSGGSGGFGPRDDLYPATCSPLNGN